MNKQVLQTLGVPLLDALEAGAVPIDAARALPAGTSGVYALFDGALLRYVGQSVDLKRRIATHAAQRDSRVRVNWILKAVAELDVVESACIYAWLPPENGRPPMSQDQVTNQLGGAVSGTVKWVQMVVNVPAPLRKAIAQQAIERTSSAQAIVLKALEAYGFSEARGHAFDRRRAVR